MSACSTVKQQQHYLKKFGNKAEVYEGKALQTRGGLKFDDLYVSDEGVLKSRRQKQNKQEVEVAVEKSSVYEDDGSGSDNSGDDKGTPAIPKNNLKIQDIKDAIKSELSKNKLSLPKGSSKWKRLDWINKAVEMGIVEI